jgi:hypothetical protein
LLAAAPDAQDEVIELLDRGEERLDRRGVTR